LSRFERKDFTKILRGMKNKALPPAPLAEKRISKKLKGSRILPIRRRKESCPKTPKIRNSACGFACGAGKNEKYSNLF